MTLSQQLDRTYHFILESFVKRGQAPHFTEIAREFSVSPDAGKKLLHDLMDNAKMPIPSVPTCLRHLPPHILL